MEQPVVSDTLGSHTSHDLMRLSCTHICRDPESSIFPFSAMFLTSRTSFQFQSPRHIPQLVPQHPPSFPHFPRLAWPSRPPARWSAASRALDRRRLQLRGQRRRGPVNTPSENTKRVEKRQ